MINKKKFEDFVDKTCAEYGCETLVIFSKPAALASLTNDFSDTDFKPEFDPQTAKTLHLDFKIWKYVTAKNNVARCIEYKKLRYGEADMYAVPAKPPICFKHYPYSEYINTPESTDLPRKVDTGLMKPV